MANHEEGSIKELWKITYPLVISTASQTLMMFVSRVFLSWHSKEALAASVPAGITSFTILSIFFGVASYSNVFVAQFHGSNNRARLTSAVWQGVWFSIFSLFIIALITPLAVLIFKYSNHPENIKVLEVKYFMMISFFGGLPVISTALSSFFTGRGLTRITMIVNLIGNIVNILICYFLILGKGPFPKLGITGAAIALVAGNLLTIIIYFSLFLSTENRKKYKTKLLYGFHYPIFKNLLKFGIPNGLGIVLEVSAWSIFVFLVGNVGESALVANNIILTIEMLAFMPILGAGIATSTLVGQYIGMNKHDVVNKVTKSALSLTVGYAAFLAVIYLFFPKLLIALFAPQNSQDFNQVLEQTLPLMKVLAVYILSDVINTTYASAIKGAGDTKFHMMASTLLAWAFFAPGIYIILQVYKLSLLTAWTFSSAYLLILAAIFYFRFKSDRWRNINMLGVR